MLICNKKIYWLLLMSLFVCACGIGFGFCRFCLCVLFLLDCSVLSLYRLIIDHFWLLHQNTVLVPLEEEFVNFDLFGFVQCYLMLAMF
jgi:hypothetical protein